MVVNCCAVVLLITVIAMIEHLQPGCVLQHMP